MPRTSWIKFYGAVFCIFAPLMTLFTAPLGADWSPLAVAFWSALSGAIAIGWAWCFTHGSPRYLAVVVPAQVALIAWMASGWPSFLAIRSPGPSVYAFFVIASVVLGYIAFIWFIQGEGARALRIQTEMRLAQRIHDHLVPNISARIGAFEIEGRSFASGSMGGDLIDLVERNGSAHLCLADVSGHGVRAGVLMAALKASYRAALRDDPAPSEAARAVSDVLDQIREPDMFATLATVRLDGARAACALAGHLPLIVVRAATGMAERIDNHSLPAGIDPDEDIPDQPIELAPGDLLALYTDGLTEAITPSGAQLGIDALETIIKPHARKPLADAVDAILDEVSAQTTSDDDQTLLLIRMTG